MPSIVQCPACRQELRLPDHLAGQQVRCPACGQAFAGETGPPPPAAVPALELDDRAAPPPLPRPTQPPPSPAPDLVPCRFCGERIAADARRCRYCGEASEGGRDSGPGWEHAPFPGRFRRDWEPHRGPLVLTLGILSIILCGFLWTIPLGIAAWVLGRNDLQRMKDGMMDPSGESTTQAGMVCGIVGTVLAVIQLATCGLMFLAALAG